MYCGTSSTKVIHHQRTFEYVVFKFDGWFFTTVLSSLWYKQLAFNSIVVVCFYRHIFWQTLINVFWKCLLFSLLKQLKASEIVKQFVHQRDDYPRWKQILKSLKIHTLHWTRNFKQFQVKWKYLLWAWQHYIDTRKQITFSFESINPAVFRRNIPAYHSSRKLWLTMQLA